ncbi:MAG: diguanylate cyclase [Rubrivivax sp.]
MSASSAKTPTSAALRVARRAWRMLYSDSRQCLELADQAFARARQQGDAGAMGRAQLARGFHLIWYATPAEAMAELQAAQQHLDAAADRAGFVLAEIGLARALWRDGQVHESLERVMPLRDEALRLFKRDERAVLLNTIAGCYSEGGDSQQAFAYMYQALRETSSARNRGLDVVLYCNLAHELIQLGDYHQALSYVQEGMAGGAQLNNPRLRSVLHINRVICLTQLGRAAEALNDAHLLLQLPADGDGRGPMNAHYEDLAIAALRGGDVALGADLVARATQALSAGSVSDERMTLTLASAELLLARNQPEQALQRLQLAPIGSDAEAGTSLRLRCLYFDMLANLLQRVGHSEAALQALRSWQVLQTERSLLASSARYQAFALQVELLRLKHQLSAADARRRDTERARVELVAANRQLQRKVAEVEALQQALKQQATRDFLTGLFNRRHMNDVLPSMLAMAQRDRQPLAVVIIDLDHFKKVNDSLGHAAGDKLLAQFGELLSQQCRRSDVACRYGGEEFCLLLPRTLASAARRKALSLLRAWAALIDAQEQKPPGGQSFSAGVADSSHWPGSAAELLGAADEALLHAKALGRNRVLLSSAPSRAAA